MSVEYLKILEKALEGIELTEEENRLVEWIAGWDLWTVQQFRQIIKKCRESDNQHLEEKNMIDIYVDDVRLKEIQYKEKQVLKFVNAEKDESVMMVVTNDELVNMYDRIKMRCETLNLIPIINSQN